ncbi:lipopolysaccharide biosynthesis protein [Winogradskyella poriferorum]|uniref:lipopolysaccharide biosynthesis protein n=1 Tax=Winogradskyella poriferorum TaxID=307627 RepID=UPI003D650C97
MISKTGAYFTVSTMTMNIVTMLANLITIRWISPEDIGLWNGYFIFVSYIYFIQLGVVNGLSRELPFYLGKKKENVAVGLARTSLSVVSVNTALVLVFGFFFIWYSAVKSTSLGNVFYTSISIVVLMALQFYTNYLVSTFRSNNSFKKLTYIYVGMSVFIPVSLLLVMYYNYLGHIIRIPLVALVQLIALHLYRPFKIKPKFKLKFFKLLTSTGIPLFVFNYITLLANTFGRLILLQVGTALQMGLYSPAIAVNTAMRLIPVTLSQYIYPKLSYIAGESDSKITIWKLAIKVSFYVSLVLLPITIVGYLLMPWFIETIFPNYTQGIFAAQLATIAGLFSGASIGFVTSLNTMKAFKHIGMLSIARAVIFYGLIFSLAISMNALDGVAYGVLFSEIVYFIMAVVISRHYFKENK